MKETPILFTPANVRLLLSGAKTQTRRVIEPQPQPDGGRGLSPVLPYHTSLGKWTWVLAATGHGDGTSGKWCPYGIVGDHLWVKEAWRLGKPHDKRKGSEVWEHLTEIGKGVTVLYEAGGWKSVAPFERAHPKYKDDEPMPEWAGRKRSAMFMPRWASRIILEITDVRVERVQSISHEDAIAEGCKGYGWVSGSPYISGPHTEDGKLPQEEYKELWDSINSDKHPWKSNPFVWCLSFKLVTP